MICKRPFIGKYIEMYNVENDLCIFLGVVST